MFTACRCESFPSTICGKSQAIKPGHLFFTPLKRPFKRTLSPRAAGCLLVALGPLGRARRMSEKVEDGARHEHAKVGLRVLDEGQSKLFSVFSQCFHTLYAPTFRPLAAICRPWDRPPAPDPTTTRPQTPPETFRCYTRDPRGVKRCAAAPSAGCMPGAGGLDPGKPVPAERDAAPLLAHPAGALGRPAQPPMVELGRPCSHPRPRRSTGREAAHGRASAAALSRAASEATVRLLRVACRERDAAAAVSRRWEARAGAAGENPAQNESI